MRLLPDDEADDSDYHQAQLRFDDGGMRGLACALCWCGLVYHVSGLKEKVFVCQPVIDLVKSLLSLPSIHKTQGDSATAMIRRIIKQNVDSKKMAVSSFEWSQILSSMRKDGQHLSVADAIEMYNANPEVHAHGGSSGKDMIRV